MPLITLDNISISFSEKPILDGVSGTIMKDDKIALIGRNGEGKSTFMRMLAGEIQADDGVLKIKKGVKISHLEQTPPQDNDKTLFDIVADGLGDVGQIVSRYHLLLTETRFKRLANYKNKLSI